MNSDKLVIISITSITLIIFGLIAYSSFKTPIAKDLSPEALFGNTQNYKGKAPGEAKLVLVEFSDFECPYCATIFPVVDSLTDIYPEISVVYKHLPLNIHRYALPAAKASEAAAKQGKFWEYAAKLFDNQPKYSDSELISYAESLGLNIDQFKADMNSDEVLNKVNAEEEYAKNIGVKGTPSFYIVFDNKVEAVNMSDGIPLEEKIRIKLGEVAANPTDNAPESSQSTTIPEGLKSDIVTALNAQGSTFTNADVIDIAPTNWPDASLGCPAEGQSYAQVITSGFVIKMKQGENVVEYNSNADFSNIVTCEKK